MEKRGNVPLKYIDLLKLKHMRIFITRIFSKRFFHVIRDTFQVKLKRW